MNELRFDGIDIVVDDMAAAVTFYGLLGLEVQQTPEPWVRHHRKVGGIGAVDIDLDTTAFASTWDGGWEPGRTGVVFNFRTASRDDVDRLHAALTAAGHTSAQAPYDAFWGARYAVLIDPAGNHVGLMSESDPTKRSAGPDPATF